MNAADLGSNRSSFDVVIAGGGLVGSAAAYHLTEHSGFAGSVVVVEPDQTYAKAASALSAASVREQFSHPINIKASHYGMEFFNDFHARVQVEGESPDLGFVGTGYLFLANEVSLPAMRDLNTWQRGEGVEAQMLDPVQIAEMFPYLAVDELAGAALGSCREGTLDAWALLNGMKRRAQHNGARYLTDSVVGLRCQGGQWSASN